MDSGEILGQRYRIDREIGRGSFGVVYRADDLNGQRACAVKILLPWAARNEQLRHRLRREARLAATLRSPHAVEVFDSGETTGGDVYLAMELLEGEELSVTLAREGPFSPERVANLSRQVLSALADAHRLGVVHRDLKPSNIFLCRDADGGECVKVFDFGIAKITGDGELMATAKLTHNGGVIGTPVYMSLEQCRGGDLSPASDFYSLGIVLFELLTGRVPFDHENPVQVLLLHNQAAPPDLPAEIAATPVGRAVLRALEKDPARRFSSAEQFSRALAGEPVEDPPPSLASLHAPATGSVRSADSPARSSYDTLEMAAPPAGDAADGGGWLIGLGIAVAVIVIVGAGVAVLFGGF